MCWHQQKGAGSSAWLERSTDNRKVAGSNPARPTSTLGKLKFFSSMHNLLSNDTLIVVIV